MAIDPQAQTSIEEKPLENRELEQALETRHALNLELRLHRKQFNEADATARGMLVEFQIADGEVVRCGRFRIAKKAIPAQTRNFEIKPTSRLTIKPVDGTL